MPLGFAHEPIAENYGVYEIHECFDYHLIAYIGLGRLVGQGIDTGAQRKHAAPQPITVVQSCELLPVDEKDGVL